MKLNKSGLMLFGGVVGFVATNVLTAIGAIKYHEAKQAMDHDPTLKEEALLIAKSYGAAATVGAVSAGLIFGGNKTYAKAQAGLVSAYTLASTKYLQGKNVVAKVLGEDAVKQIETSLKEPIVEHAKKTHVPAGSILVCDTYGGKEPRYLETTMEELMDAEYQLNRILAKLGYVGLSDWYDLLGFDTTLAADQLGWNVTYLCDISEASEGLVWIDFEHELVLEDNNQYYILKFAVEPVAGYREGYEF